jgi:hypothetical protein
MPSGALITFALNVGSAFVALLTSYYAYRSNRLVGNPVLGGINIGFMLLGIGLAVDAGTSLVSGRLLVEFPAERSLTLIASFSYLAIQMAAYLVVALSYARATYGKHGMALPAAVVGAAALGLYQFSLVSYFMSVLLLAFIVFQGLLLRTGGKNRFSSMVLLAFGLVLVAHLFLLFSVLVLGSGVFLIGTGIQFFGFLSLLAFVLRSEVVGPK